MENIVLIGYGGHAKSISDCIERQGKYCIIGYTDSEDRNCQYKYLGTDDVLENIFNNGVRNAFICVGYLGKGKIREEIFDRIKEIGFTLPTIIDPSTIISKSTYIDEGTFIAKGCILNADAHIGKCCIINTGAIIEHESVVNDYAHISVGTILCGQVVIGRGAFVGANATVIQCRKVLDYEIVPAGVTRR